MATTTTTSPQAHNAPTFPTLATTTTTTDSSSSSNNNNSARLPPMRRISSSAKERLSVYSNVSQNRSRPVSHVFPLFHSSLSYALVRDFAYAPIHPLHYGPLPVPSRASTPASEGRRLSDPQAGAWGEATRNSNSWASSNNSIGTSAAETYGNQQQLPAVSFGDGGPPYSEDEDLHSPIITARYRKHKSVHTFGGDRGRSPGDGTDGRHGAGGDGNGSGSGSGSGSGRWTEETDRGTLVAVNGDGSETYYVQGDQDGSDGPGGEYITYPAGESRYSQYAYSYGHGNGALADGTQGLLLSPSNASGDYGYEDEYSDRYSRDYHFSIGSPDEEMHGKAVALFDFTREHENELPLKEGQVILVSYRHGQGWLVAEDPRTGESGLVPEEFVRLVRDIEGGLSSLNGELSAVVLDGNEQQFTAASTADLPGEEQQTAATTTTTAAAAANGNTQDDKHLPGTSNTSTGEKTTENGG
ncbi:hypothetical protein UA08_00086 [Talaromyces atroroseus]|uniref:SH3 domain-containing protein n=1 Tax=Talaromyces atroroseus TaxID=1441469 RepID=A0A225BDM8_TALAT|nr:hypothetical protein UA08_00086 [Talaromyces atroroseus]OKL64127.1 hypothetical protein UA08_00086 [Talaromyces atroroseus]